MDNYSDEDINLIISSYEQNLINNVVKDPKIPQYVEYLKNKLHYRINGISEDDFFKRRHQITNEDLYTIHKLVERLKQGKTLNQTKKTINGMSGNMSNFCPFDANEQLVEGKFDILPKVQGAMDDYHKKMKKLQKKRVNWKKTNDYNLENNNHAQNNYESNTSVAGIRNNYYGNEMNSQRPQIDFEHHSNMSNSQMSQMSNINNNNNNFDIHSRINEISNNINSSESKFDNYNNLNMPHMAYNKKDSYQRNNNNNNESFDNSRMTNYANDRYFQDINNNLNTRSKGVPGQLPVEHQYDYLNENPNKVIDTRLVGEPTRQDNHGYFR
jgi:hypothetical protein